MSKIIDPRHHNSADPLFVPRWKHHATKPSVIVRSQEDLDRLGEGYGDLILQDHPNGYMKGNKPKPEAKIEAKIEAADGESSSPAVDEKSPRASRLSKKA